VRVLDALAEAERVVNGAEPAEKSSGWRPSVTRRILAAVRARGVRTIDPQSKFASRQTPGSGRSRSSWPAGRRRHVNNRAKDRRVRYLPIFRDELVAIVSPSHPWATRPFVAAADFATEHLIHYATTRSELTIFKDVLRPAGVQPRRVSPVLLTEAILEMVRSGLGVAVLAHWAAAPYVERAQVRVPDHAAGLRRRWFRRACQRGERAGSAALGGGSYARPACLWRSRRRAQKACKSIWNHPPSDSGYSARNSPGAAHFLLNRTTALFLCLASAG
jgi:hypothetical protein